jgi:hypothetical protein
VSGGRFTAVVHGSWETGGRLPVLPAAAVLIVAALVSWLATLLWLIAAVLGAFLVLALGGLVFVHRYNRRETGRFIGRMGAQPAIAPPAAAAAAVVNHYHLHLAPGATAEGLDWAIPHRDAITITTETGERK